MLVLGGCSWSNENKNNVYAICSYIIRKKAIRKLNGIKFATVIEPNVVVSDRVIIGEGSIIYTGSTITVNVEIGLHLIINLNYTIGHDTVLKNFVTLYQSVNISDNTILEERVEMRTGS